MTEAEQLTTIITRMFGDLPWTCDNIYKIRDKAGRISPFTLNPAQLVLHEKLEQQKRASGRVRAIIVKARQMGSSTYLAARMYHLLSHRIGYRGFVLAHLDVASQNLAGMFRRFHEFTPADLRPHVDKANTKEISFKGQESGLKIATAGSQDVGRSETIQAFWGSEQAFWENSEEHSAGIRQAISGSEGSEDIRESTANGLNSYYREWSAAVRGQSDYIPVFLPWFLDPLYRYEGDEELSFTQEWLDYAELYSLSEEQLKWAYRKNREMAGTLGLDFGEPCWQFKQEYPSNSSEAFLSSGDETFISTLAVAQARQARASKYGPRVLGVDPARGGGDKTALVDRQGRRLGLEVCELIDDPDLMLLAGKIVNIQREYNFDKITIDTTGLGAGLFDRLHELLGDRVVGVNFSSRASQPEKYANRRAEMWCQLRDWFTQTPTEVQMLDDDNLAMDVLAPIWAPGATVFRSNGAVLIEPKEKIKERLGHSPDLADAAALTFGYPIHMEAMRQSGPPVQYYDEGLPSSRPDPYRGAF